MKINGKAQDAFDTSEAGKWSATPVECSFAAHCGEDLARKPVWIQVNLTSRRALTPYGIEYFDATTPVACVEKWPPEKLPT